MFPVGALDKAAVRDARARARAAGRGEAGQPRDLLRARRRSRRVPRAPGRARAGAATFATSTASVVGRHDGVHRFTVGQRKGLGLSSPVRLYVVGIDAGRADGDRRPARGARAAHARRRRTSTGLPGRRRRRHARDRADPPPPRRGGRVTSYPGPTRPCTSPSTSPSTPSRPDRRWCSTTATWCWVGGGSESLKSDVEV